VGKLSFRVQRLRAAHRQATHAGDRGKQLPPATPHKAGVQEKLQFFKEAGESYEGVFLGFSLSQLWLALRCHTFCNTSRETKRAAKSPKSVGTHGDGHRF